MERFKIGQKVRSTVDAQGLRNGETYEVTDVNSKPLMFGTYTTYEVWDAEQLRSISVGNGHLVLTEAEAVPESVHAYETEPTTVEPFLRNADLPPLSPTTVDVSYEDGPGGVIRLSRSIRCF